MLGFDGKALQRSGFFFLPRVCIAAEIVLGGGSPLVVVLQLRVYALYYRSKNILGLTVSIFGVCLIASSILIGMSLSKSGGKCITFRFNSGTLTAYQEP